MEQNNTPSAYDGAVVFEARLDAAPFEAGVAQLGATLSRMIEEMAGASDAAVKLGEDVLLSLSPLPAGTGAVAAAAADAFLAPFGTMSAGAAAAAGTVKTGILGALASLPSELAGLGQSAMAGLLSAVSGAAQSMAATLSNMLRSAVDAAKAALEIRSPSRVMAREVGVPMAQGVQLGLDSALPELEKGVARSFSFSGIVSAAQAPNVPKKENPSLALGGITVNWYGGGSDVDVDRLARRLGQRVHGEMRGKGGVL